MTVFSSFKFSASRSHILITESAPPDNKLQSQSSAVMRDVYYRPLICSISRTLTAAKCRFLRDFVDDLLSDENALFVCALRNPPGRSSASSRLTRYEFIQSHRRRVVGENQEIKIVAPSFGHNLWPSTRTMTPRKLITFDAFGTLFSPKQPM